MAPVAPTPLGSSGTKLIVPLFEGIAVVGHRAGDGEAFAEPVVGAARGHDDDPGHGEDGEGTASECAEREHERGHPGTRCRQLRNGESRGARTSLREGKRSGRRGDFAPSSRPSRSESRGRSGQYESELTTSPPFRLPRAQ